MCLLHTTNSLKLQIKPMWEDVTLKSSILFKLGTEELIVIYLPLLSEISLWVNSIRE